MLKQLKSFTLKMMGGANVASLLVMLLIGCSDRINPADHPALANAGLLFPVLLAVNLGFIVFWVLFKRAASSSHWWGFSSATRP